MSDAKGVVVTCGSCGSRLRVRGQTQGRTGKCPKCGVKVQLQLPPQQSAPAPAPSTAPAKAQAAVERVTSAEAKASGVTPAAGTFLFFPASAEKPEVRVAPATTTAPSRDSETTIRKPDAPQQPLASIALVAIASLLIGAAAMIAVRKFGGIEYWVIKRSIVAWMIGMLSAAGLIRVATERTSPLRLTAAATAVGAIVAAWLYASPAAFGPVDILTMALAVAGSGTSFILADTAPTAPAARTTPVSA